MGGRGILKKLELVGARFGRLVVINRAPSVTSDCGMVFQKWNCLCDCGNKKAIFQHCLRSRATQSCGCLARELTSRRVRIHGKSHTNEFSIWTHIIQRCDDPNNRTYGGAGISICSEWRSSFEKFLADMGPRPSKRHTIDRKDGSRGYCKDNCRWATWGQQARNRKSNRLVTVGKNTRCISEWAEITGTRKDTIRARLERGWPPEKAIA